MKWDKMLHSNSLDKIRFADGIKRIISAALEAADPADAVHHWFKRENNLLQVNGQEYSLKGFSAVYLISVGKAAISMAEAASTVLGENLSKGIVVTKHITENTLPENLTLLEASHPLPDERSLAAGERILELLEKTTPDNLVIFLISGGGSALMTAPVSGVSLGDMEKLTSLLLGSGTRIDEINTLRRSLDRVKGGGLAREAFPARIISLLLSDVVNSPLEAIASGPTVPNPTDQADALAVLEKYDLLSLIPAKIHRFLNKNELPDNIVSYPRSETLLVGSNIISAEAAKAQAEREGFSAQILTASLQGEAAMIGQNLGQMLRENCFEEYGIAKVHRPFCLILGGETTVSLGGATGCGGRNQELALAAVRDLAGVQDVVFITLATDGEDGPTNAAGAVVTGETLVRAQALELDVDAYLREHTSYLFFDALDDLVKPGSTGTNVNDLTFLFGF